MKYKLKLAKLELNVFLLLEKTNKKFSDKWKMCQHSDNEPSSFQDCIQNYQLIRELIKHNRKENITSNLLEFYYLEAGLGKIQSQLNALPQDPRNEDVLVSNDKKIDELTKSLNRLHRNTITLNLHNKKNIDKALVKDYQDFLNKISETFSFWNNKIYERKATYYYNLAVNFIDEAHKLSENNLDLDYKKISFRRV